MASIYQNFSNILLGEDWIYRGEGNSNLVISLPKTRQILRMKKAKVPHSLLEWFIDFLTRMLNWDLKKERESEMQDLKFYCNIMTILLGQNYVSPAVYIDMTRKDVQALDGTLRYLRPDFRKAKHLQYAGCTVSTDFAFLPRNLDLDCLVGVTYAVEIKPKKGWIPLLERNFDKCHFCTHQYLKLQKGQISKLSSYCPLDLFSGDKNRMLKALRGLIDTPQNNFAVFRDGVIFYGENSTKDKFKILLEEWFEDGIDSFESLVETLCNLIQKTLLKVFQLTKGCDNCDFQKNYEETAESLLAANDISKCFYASSTLPQGSILERILSVQKLDSFGLGANYNLYKTLKVNEMLNNWNYVDDLLQEVANSKGTCPRCILFNYKENFDKTQERTSLIPYLVAAVVNDCSLMLCYRRIGKITDVLPENNVISTRRGDFLVHLGVFDLYPKPLGVISKHKYRNQKMHDATNELNVRVNL